MIYLVLFILFFGIVRMLVALVNFITKVGISSHIHPDYKPFVSILIPARNEEKNIGKLLSDLSTFNYNNLEIIIYNDLSTDRTEEITNQFIETDERIKIINGANPEKGWLGKNFACNQLANEAKGDLFLFLDADVRVKNLLIEKTTSYFYKYKLKLLSVFPQQLMPVKETRYAIPLMNWILLSLLPLFLVRVSSWKSFSAANGQFMLFDALTYRKYRPHERFKSHPVEDIEILRYFKKLKMKTATLLGNEYIQCTMYHSLDEAISGFSKNIFRFFGGSVLVTILFALITTLSPFIILIFGTWQLFLVYLFIIILIRFLVSKASRQDVWENLLYSPVQQFIFLRIIFNAIKQKKNKTLIWKDRNININD